MESLQASTRTDGPSDEGGWRFVTPVHVTSARAGRRIDLRYEACGFTSGWDVVIDDVSHGRQSDLCTARMRALEIVAQGATNATGGARRAAA